MHESRHRLVTGATVSTMQALGIVLLVGSLILAGVFILAFKDARWQVMALCGAGFTAGLVLTLRPTSSAAPFRMTSELTSDALAQIDATVTRSDIAARSSTHAVRLANDASGKSTETRRRMADIQINVDKALGDVASIRIQTSYLVVVSAAECDDRRAFDQLRAWADDHTHPMSPRADRAWHKVYEQHALPFKRVNQDASWRIGLDPEQLSFKQLCVEYEEASFSKRPPLVEYIWKREDLPRKKRVRFLMDIITNDDNLTAVEYAVRFLSREFKLGLNPLDVREILAWWETIGRSTG